MKNDFIVLAIIYFILNLAPITVHAQNEMDYSINGLPAIHIELQDPDEVITKEEKLVATMQIENAYGSDYKEQQLYNGLVEISGRGNTTWGMPKKPFNIDLIDAEGEDNPAALLGMPEDE